MPRHPRKVRRMPDEISKSAPTKTARIQRTPDGRLLGAAIFLDAEVIEPFVTDGAEVIEGELKVAPGGVFIEIGGRQ